MSVRSRELERKCRSLRRQAHGRRHREICVRVRLRAVGPAWDRASQRLACIVERETTMATFERASLVRSLVKPTRWSTEHEPRPPSAPRPGNGRRFGSRHRARRSWHPGHRGDCSLMFGPTAGIGHRLMRHSLAGHVPKQCERQSAPQGLGKGTPWTRPASCTAAEATAS